MARPAVLDFTLKPGEEEAEGKAGAAYRGDTFTHSFSFTEGGVPFPVEGTLAGQIRSEYLTDEDAEDPPAALADFTVTQDTPGTVVITLAPAVTLTLPSDWKWDLQQTNAGVVTTLFRGKGKTIDDATR